MNDAKESRRRGWGRLLLALSILTACAYVGSYIWFRSAHTETWDRDGQRYLIFPEDRPAAYYLFRPLMYADGFLFDMQFHIGPHR